MCSGVAGGRKACPELGGGQHLAKTQRGVIPAQTAEGDDCNGKRSPNTLLMYVDGLTDIVTHGGVCTLTTSRNLMDETFTFSTGDVCIQSDLLPFDEIPVRYFNHFSIQRATVQSVLTVGGGQPVTGCQAWIPSNQTLLTTRTSLL